MNTPSGFVSPIHRDLRAATSHLHRRLDTRLPFSNADITIYRRVIQAYYGFYLPLEWLLAGQASIIPGIDWPKRIKTPFLRQDLLALELTGSEIDALPVCQRLPVVDTMAQALGVLYVVEGATLGGQALRDLIEVKIGIEAGTGGAFMNVYGTGTSALWQGFLECLHKLHEPDQKAQAVAAALQTFLCFEEWLEASEVLQ